MVTWVVIWGLSAVVCAVLAGFLAAWKRRDHSFWAAWTFLLPPVLLIVLLMPRNTGVRRRARTLDEEDAAETS